MTQAFRTAAQDRNPRILIIDDEAEMREFLSDALMQNGYRTVAVGSGDAALACARGERFNMAVCDLNMPGINGLETLEKLRAIDPDIELIIVTGYGTLESAIESLRLGVFDFLQKPVNLKDLLFSVRKALERRDMRERLALYELSRTIFSTLEAEDLYGRIIKSAMSVLRADDASLMLVDANGDLFIALSASLQQEILQGTHLALGERVAGRVAQQPEPIVINDDATTDERFRGIRSLRPMKASIVCPLTMRGKLIGVLNVNRVSVAEHYTEHDRQNAMILASLVSLALGNARLHTELQARLMQIRDSHEEVIQTEKMTALGNLLSGVAHELNNPLCGILGYAQLLQQSSPDPKSRKGVDVILREAERASRIVSNLLSFVRREKPDKQPIAVNAVITRALQRKASDLKVCQIGVTADLDPNLPAVLGDGHQLQVVFGHLITNAQQAMFEANGKGTLTVRTRVHDRRVLIEFADEGPGIPEENRRRVFDPFFTTREVGKGVGLGLSVCFAIVRDHVGAIRVAPGPRGGAIFTIELPIADREKRQEEADDAADATVANGSHEKVAARVLVAQEEPRLQDMLVEILVEMGCQVDAAGDSEAVLERIRSGHYDALIADYAMPRLDGHALMNALGARDPSLLRRVIFLAGDTTNPRLMEFAAVSGNQVIGKPFDIEVMRSAVRRLLAATGTGDASVN